jgi:hypothetical protein
MLQKNSTACHDSGMVHKDVFHVPQPPHMLDEDSMTYLTDPLSALQGT